MSPRPLSVHQVAALALCLAALSSMGPAQPPSKLHAQRREAAKPAPVLSDEALQRAISRRFAASKISQNAFAVTVRNGVATLTGTARVPQHKGVATRLAKTAGAREVLNQIEISPEGKARANARPHASASPRRTPKVAPALSSVPPPDSRKEPEAIPDSTASNEGTQAKKFRILSGQPSGSPPGSARQPRIRRY